MFRGVDFIINELLLYAKIKAFAEYAKEITMEQNSEHFDFPDKHSIKSNYGIAGMAIFSGLYILLLGFGFFPVDENNVHAPGWLIVAAGMIFITSGISVLGIGVFARRTTDLLGALILSDFSLICCWIAFGSGSRVFGGGATPLIGRIVFGIGADICIFIALLAWKRIFTKEIKDQDVLVVKRSAIPVWSVLVVIIILLTEVIVLSMFIDNDGTLKIWKIVSPTHMQTLPVYTNNPQSSHIDTQSGVSINQQTGQKILSYQVKKIWDYPFVQPRALAIDQNNNVYVSETYQGDGTHSQILKFDSGGILLGWWGKGNVTSGWHAATSSERNVGNGNAPGEFNYIFKIAFDSRGNMYVIDRNKYYDTNGNWHTSGIERVQRFNQVGKFMDQLDNSALGWHTATEAFSSTTSNEDFSLNDSSCVAIYGNDLILGSWGKNRIDKFDLKTGDPIEWLGKNEIGDYGWHANGVAVAAPYWGTEVGAFNGVIDCRITNGQLSVVSYASNPVVATFDYGSGQYLKGLSHNEGHKPQELIFDKFGNMIFSDNYEGSIKFLDKEFHVTTKMQLGPGGNYFGVGDFAFDSNGSLYFIEQQKQKLYQLELAY